MMLGATGVLVGPSSSTRCSCRTSWGASPLETGLAFLPLALVILVAAHFASHRHVRHLGTRIVMAAGLLIAGGGALLLSGAPGRRVVPRRPAAGLPGARVRDRADVRRRVGDRDERRLARAGGPGVGVHDDQARTRRRAGRGRVGVGPRKDGDA